eukprot:6194105-Pleurochrysis_carterae.AAC.4
MRSVTVLTPGPCSEHCKHAGGGAPLAQGRAQCYERTRVRARGESVGAASMAVGSSAGARARRIEVSVVPHEALVLGVADRVGVVGVVLVENGVDVLGLQVHAEEAARTAEERASAACSGSLHTSEYNAHAPFSTHSDLTPPRRTRQNDRKRSS